MQLNLKLKTTIDPDRSTYILALLHQGFIKAFVECFNLIYTHLSEQYHDIAHLSVHISS